jgi:hypothetical protein
LALCAGFTLTAFGAVTATAQATPYADSQGFGVLISPQVRVLFWAPAAHPFPPHFEAYVERFLEDIAQANPAAKGEEDVFTVLEQYWGQVPGIEAPFRNISQPRYAGAVHDEEAFANDCEDEYEKSSACVTEQEIEEQVAAMKAKLGGDESEELWAVLTPPEVAVCVPAGKSPDCGGLKNFDAFCGFHGPQLGGEAPYAIVPFELGECIDPGQHAPEEPPESPEPRSEAAVLMALEHELAEATSDQALSGWMLNEEPFVSGRNGNYGKEIADYCTVAEQWPPKLGEVQGQPYNQVINGHHYWLIGLWSDALGGCAGSFKAPLQAAFSQVVAQAGKPTTFSAQRSSDSGGPASARGSNGEMVDASGKIAHYDWSFGDGQSASTSSPEITHTYAKGGTYVVTLTIGDQNSDEEASLSQFEGSGKEEPPITNTVVHTIEVPEAPPSTTTTTTSSGASTTTTTTTTTTSTSSGATSTITTSTTSSGASQPPAATGAARTPAAPTHAPGAPAGRVAILAGKRLLVRGHLAIVRLRCIGVSSARCSGQVLLRLRRRGRAAALLRAARRRRARAHAAPTIAKASFTIVGGRTSAVRLMLGRSALRLLARAHGRLAATLLVRSHAASGTDTIQARQTTLVTARTLKSRRRVRGRRRESCHPRLC